MTLEEEFQAWQKTVPSEIREDVIWHSATYRLAAFAADWLRPDIELLAGNPRTASVADQLDRAVGSIGAHFSDGYGRRSPRDRIRYYEYGLCSGRECRHFCFQHRHRFSPERANKAIELFTRITQIFTATIVRERGKAGF